MTAEKTIHAQILTPEGAKFEGDIISITVPGALGSFQMLYNHAPIVSALDVGTVQIEKPDGTKLVYAVSGGFVEMNDNKVTLLAERAIEPELIDVEKARLELAGIKEKMHDFSVVFDDIEREKRIAENLIKTATSL
ncbi:ATP synthase F1 subunit epsilon [Rhodohalobacter sp. SW132]|uniref:ATP synthase F1 subunit epsilon n=1 Tax=Rhodohalobacter sp. SW132 TaxID=2293433 RepID=UPI000E27B84A|nr:ATP synthase F1 subunit epsilon [Rhodohalobacter sp. SW132]REL37843.1 ATP synthase F1 subunit epsilon [Rhodohalobacter sp. SW132]